MRIAKSPPKKPSSKGKTGEPDIAYYACVDSWVVLDGKPYKFINLTGEEFARWLRAAVPEEQSDIPAFLLESLYPADDPLEQWYIVDSVAQRGVHVPLFASREASVAAAGMV